MADSAPRQTHELRRDGELITKTYRSWARGEHRREWAALNLLAEHRPGLAPEPVRADLEGTPPSITMTVVPGRPIAGRWTDDQVDLLAEAMTRLWSVPTELDSIGVHAPDYWRRLVATSIRPSGGTEQKVYDLASAWINGPALDDLLDGSAPQVFGQGDPQTGNLLLDHNRIRLVDFEDARASDACFELANFAEHLGNRAPDWTGWPSVSRSTPYGCGSAGGCWQSSGSSACCRSARSGLRTSPARPTACWSCSPVREPGRFSCRDRRARTQPVRTHARSAGPRPCRRRPGRPRPGHPG